MKSFEQNKAKSVRKQEKYTSNVQVKTQNNSQKIGICPNCNEKLPEAAIFCPECGSSTGHLCPKCSAPASPTADICQTCGAWLLEGQCKFCYAEVPDKALFCPECGKPIDGIPCPYCGKLSIFDFCSNCGKPVTEEAIIELQYAQEEIQKLISSGMPEMTTMDMAKKTFNSNQEARRWFNAFVIAEKAGIEAELSRLDVLVNTKPESDLILNETPPPPPVRKPLFSDMQLASIKKTGEAVDEVAWQRLEAERIAEEKRREEQRIAEEKRKAEEAERKRKEAERQRQIKEAQVRKEELERKLRNRSWRCNAYGVIHSGGPNECADPSRGGYYV